MTPLEDSTPVTLRDPDDAVVSIHTRAREEGLLAPGERVVVLVSGGRDSSCLLELAREICGAGAVTAVHVNYGLRADADGDERAVAAHCERLGVPLAVHRPSGPAAGNLQAWAREERYGFGRSVASTAAAWLATGHTASDQVETILYRLASSPSRRALLGMRPRGAGVIRPLLSSTRQEVTAYCLARGLAWREDASNSDEVYARNRIRHELLPALRRVHPAAERNVLAVAALLREEEELLESQVDAVLGGGAEILQETLRRLPAPLGRRVLQRLADGAAGRPAPGAARRIEEVLALRPDAALDLPHGVRAEVRHGTLRLVSRT